MISNKNVWDVTNQQPTGNQIKETKWCWIGHTHFEENRGRYREGGIGLESTGCTETRSSKKNLEEDG
jgi:hypothetical protein